MLGERGAGIARLRLGLRLVRRGVEARRWDDDIHLMRCLFRCYAGVYSEGDKVDEAVVCSLMTFCILIHGQGSPSSGMTIQETDTQASSSVPAELFSQKVYQVPPLNLRTRLPT